MIFPILDLEKIVQERDKTRLNAKNSFVSGDTAITVVEISPYRGAALISVPLTSMCLDWMYEYTVDVVEDENDKIDFNEGAADLVAQIPEGEYTLAELCVQIAAAMTAAGGQSYSASYADGKITISAVANFSILVASGDNAEEGILTEVGFSADLTGAKSYSSSEIEYLEKTVTLKVSNATTNKTIVRKLPIISEEEDHLFSNDDQLRQHEHEINKYLPAGRSSFKNVHRRAQTLMIDWLNKEGYTDETGEKLTKDRVVDITEVRQWATFMTLRLIMEDMSNALDDIYAEKAKRYRELENSFRDAAVLRLDTNLDGEITLGEGLDVQNGFVVRK